MTELSFLVDLLLNHKLPKATKEHIATRIKEVECRTSSYSQPRVSPSQPLSQPSSSSLPPHIASQSPSTQAAMLRQLQAQPTPAVATHPVEPPRTDEAQHIAADAPKPVEVIAQTPQAIQAMAARNAMIASAANGKPPAKNRQFK